MALAAVIALGGCGVPKRQEVEGNKKVDRIGEAASLHMSITSIAPWDEVKGALSPNFKLDAAEALTRAIPTTLTRSDRVLQILRLQASVAPSIVKETSTTTRSSSPGQAVDVSTQEKTEKLPPEAPTVNGGGAFVAAAPASIAAPESGADAMLQYQTAANLLRDVAVMNSEIEHVARRTGTTPYLARIRVSIMGLRPNLGYTTFANVTMFGTSDTYDEDSGRLELGSQRPTAPLIIPILSTDAVQATRRTNSALARRELSLALSLLKGAGALGAGVDSAAEREEGAAGSDLESVVTVGGQTNNTLRIRMGADPLPGGGYGMTSRTFSVSAVVFVAKPSRQLQYVSRLSMHDVEDAKEVSAAYGDTYRSGLAQIEKDYGEEFDLKDKLKVLDDHVLHGNYAAFETDLISEQRWKSSRSDSERQELRRKAMYVWAQLTALLRHSRYAIGSVTLPRTPEPVCPEAGQIVAYRSSEKGIEVSLRRALHLRPNDVGAHLLLRAQCPASPVASSTVDTGTAPKTKVSSRRSMGSGGGKEVPASANCTQGAADRREPFLWSASSIEVAKDGKSLVASFPAIDKISLLGARAGRSLSPESIALICSPGAKPTTYKFVATLPPDVEKKADSQVASDLVPDTSIIVVERGKGEISFGVVGGGKQNLHVIVRNADVSGFVDETGKATPRKGQAWSVADGGRYVIRATSMTERLPVRLELVSIGADSKRTPVKTQEVAVDEKRR